MIKKLTTPGLNIICGRIYFSLVTEFFIIQPRDTFKPQFYVYRVRNIVVIIAARLDSVILIRESILTL